MGFLGLTYRRPAQQPVGVALPEVSQESPEQQSSWSYASSRIPDALSFDRIIEGGTCPPCTVLDFMNYLICIEHSAENLQFFLWHRSYVTRFHSADTADLVLAPEWTKEQQDEAFDKLQREYRNGLKRDPAAVAGVFRGTDFEKRGNVGSPNTSFLSRPSPVFSETGSDPFSTPPRTPGDDDGVSSVSWFGRNSSNALSWRNQAGEAFAAAGIRAPFTIQPFREEIDRVIATYIKDGAPRQLNLSARERQQVLLALSHTTHPSAFRQCSRSVEAALRLQSHPNFVRWSVGNGNPARIVFAKVLGAVLMTGSLAAYVLLCLSSVPRGLRAVPAVGMMLGAATQFAAAKGVCVVLHGMHHQHVRPWELFADDEMELREDGAGDEKGTRSPHGSFESFGSANSYEDQPWAAKYQKRNVARKVFDREVWIREPALRSIQDTMFVQALLVAAVTTGVLTAVFVCVPRGDFF